MNSPPIPSYLRGGLQPADDIVDLSREASMENLRELQRYAESFSSKQHVFVINGIQDQIMDEQVKVQNWISGMLGDLNRLRRVQGISSLQCLWPHLQVRRRYKHHPVQLLMFQCIVCKQLHPQRIRLWRVLQGMQFSKVLIHGLMIRSQA